MMMNGQKKAAAEVAVQLPESKMVAGSMSGPFGGASGGGTAAGLRRPFGRKAEVMNVLLRVLCMVTSVAAVSFMVTSQQSSTVSIYGFTLPIQSKWSFSHSFEYLVGVSAAVAAHSLLQLLISISRLLRKSPGIPSRNHAWLVFAGDQVFAYAMISAGAAASGVTNLNRTGIRHTALPNFCKPLRSFCDHVAVSIFFTFFSCFLLAASAVQEVVWLSRSKY
ncbi:CASP-LIKE PROTEIN 3A2 [Salix purpurea]|uniref:CASP-like protein n=1 Tax=Salix purpurea TaxID=77065 RepID=A0A9Q0YVC7_SALPP|nr:CASP-LIKE PROTEIN 3A2 [Salix purpurea]